jgi:tetratricopeptide (TPR) repeat protein
LSWDRRQGEQAEQAVRAGIEIRKRLYKRGQLDQSSQRYLGRAYSDLGMIVAGRGRLVEAEKIYRQAADLLGGLQKEYPDGIFYRGDLIRTRLRQARLQAKLGNYHQAAKYYRQAVQVDPKNAEANNGLAWFLATCAEPSLRDGHEAVLLAKKAVAAESRGGDWWNTLGVAYYRVGDYKAATLTLEKSMKFRSGGDSYDWFFLAMAHWKLGNREEARGWLTRGIRWLEKHKTHEEDLDRFQAEAQALLNTSGLPR